MSATQVIEQVEKLPIEEQREIFQVLRARFADEPSPEQIAEFERRAERLRRNPEIGIPWERVRAELKERLESRRACPAK
jgi:putative addiction module component (TIGR02574 family)